MEFPPQPWPVGEADPTEPLVRRVLAANPSAFTFTGTQSYVVGAAGDVAVIDPGPLENDHIAALLAAIGDAKVNAIVCTHTHKDHSPAAAPLAEQTGAPIIGCAPLVLSDDGPRSDASFDPTYKPNRVLADGESIAGEGWTLTAVATPGHTSNHLCFALAESGALFTGDHVMGWSTTVVAPPDGDMGDYMRSLEKLIARRDDILYPTHGSPIVAPRSFLRAYLSHRRMRESQIGRALMRGRDTVPALVETLYAGLAPALHRAAALTVEAHLKHMIEDGRVAALPDGRYFRN
jgi:glyoxylase-like metal-dependent hydrolase (beta-lactamase superfamily II)